MELSSRKPAPLSLWNDWLGTVATTRFLEPVSQNGTGVAIDGTRLIPWKCPQHWARGIIGDNHVKGHNCHQVLCGHAQGLSLKKIQEVTGVPKTSVKRIIDQAHTTELSIEALLHQPDEAIIELMMPSRRARMNYVEPDWERVYLNYERPRKPLGLQVCWEQYRKHAEPLGRVMSYSTFCRAYNEYKRDLPASMKDVSMAFEWTPGQVAMIDYSGDPLHYTKAEIFVAVMPYSNLTFCLATQDQTRQS